MANTCPRSIKGCALRIARLGADGVPEPGADNLATIDFVELAFEPVYNEGDVISVDDACGLPCVVFRDDDSLERVNLTLQICQLDPEVFELLGGGKVLTSGERVGYGAPLIGDAAGPEHGVSIEVWTRRYDESGNPDTFPYEWWVFPRTKAWKFGGRTVNKGHMMHVFSGYGTENDNWFDGPADALEPWPLPAESDRAWQHIPTETLPATACGYQSLVST